jgi:hypothetical protein
MDTHTWDIEVTGDICTGDIGAIVLILIPRLSCRNASSNVSAEEAFEVSEVF